jgi:two-component system KDP operon response regulator KdpE
MNNASSILVIDDEAQIRRLLEITLTAGGYKVTDAASGREGLALAASLQPDVIILDLGLPDADGFDVIRDLRLWYNHAIIILSVRSAEEDIIRALDQGANDYLTKPFRTGELLARIRAAIRITNSTSDECQVFTYGNIVIDLVNHTVKKEDELLRLTSTEFSLLSLFCRNEGRVLTHQYLLREIWGTGYIGQTQNLRVFIAQLRKKIEEDATRPSLIVTESGIGYRFGS